MEQAGVSYHEHEVHTSINKQYVSRPTSYVVPGCLEKIITLVKPFKAACTVVRV